MKRMHARALTGFLLLGCGTLGSPAQQNSLAASSPASEISFRLERPGLQVPKYQITVNEDGTGRYEGVELSVAAVRTVSREASAETSPATISAGQPFSQQLTLSPAMVHRIFALTHSAREFNIDCASKARNVADTGTKTLFYRDRASTGSCTYNFSENKNVVQLTDIFYGMAETMDSGRRLDHLHRYDRLGLDAAIAFLAQEVTDGRALELGSISGTLRSIASDAEVMERVRVRASQLLSLLPAELQSSTP